MSTSQPSRSGATGPTLLITLCGLLGLTAACLLGLDWPWLGVATCAALAALLIAAYRDGRRDTEGAQDPIDALDALLLVQDPEPPPTPRTAAELGAQLSEDALARRRHQRDRR